MTEHIEKHLPSDSENKIIINSSDLPGTYDIGTWWRSGPSYITVTDGELHELAQWIIDTIPLPDVLDTARFIRARPYDAGMYAYFAKVDGVWYDEDGREHTAKWIHAEYYDIKEIV